jgi:hypothetical protein
MGILLAALPYFRFGPQPVFQFMSRFFTASDKQFVGPSLHGIL